MYFLLLIMTFHSLFQRMATASTEAELKYLLMDNLHQYFGVQRWGIYLADQENGLIRSC